VLGRWAGRLVTGPAAFLVSGLIDLALLALYVHRHRKRHTTVLLTAVLVALGAGAGLAATPGTARADSTEPSILMDDYAFIYSSPATVEKNLKQVASLGVNTIKVSMVWSLVAPDPDSTQKPDFDASDPSAYGADAWTRYDTLVQEAGALGLGVYFQLTAPAPLWATVSHGVFGHQYPWSHEPSAADFRDFVTAVGSRYSGRYQVAASGTVLGTVSDPASAGASESPDAETTLPAVRMWGIWNEPNEIGWLSPQTVTSDHHNVLRSPSLERALTDAGYTGLAETGHANDTILIGETASRGNTRTVPFVDALFCVSAADVPLTGTAATRLGCPASGNPQQFVIDNPGLFAVSGWAHHPYSFNHRPNVPLPGAPNTITLANLGVLERALDRVDEAYGEPTGMPIYVTEYGYKSNPPNPFVRTSLAQQETWLDEGWYMSYETPRIKAMAQELLYDQPPIAGKKPGSASYWANFDSGLEFENGDAKPSYDAFRLPLWLPSQRPGSRVTVWAEIRPASVGGNASAALEFKARGSSRWTPLATLTTTNPEGFVLAHVKIPGPGSVRLGWGDVSARAVYYSRTVTISR
jgi:hypothetical protein